MSKNVRRLIPNVEPTQTGLEPAIFATGKQRLTIRPPGRPEKLDALNQKCAYLYSCYPHAWWKISANHMPALGLV